MSYGKHLKQISGNLNILRLFEIIYDAIYDLIIWIASMINQMALYFLVVFGILMDRVYKLLNVQ